MGEEDKNKSPGQTSLQALCATLGLRLATERLAGRPARQSRQDGNETQPEQCHGQRRPSAARNDEVDQEDRDRDEDGAHQRPDDRHILPAHGSSLVVANTTTRLTARRRG